MARNCLGMHVVRTGWICYAEKTHGSFILPHISQVKSPQQVMGTLVKTFMSQVENKT